MKIKWPKHGRSYYLSISKSVPLQPFENSTMTTQHLSEQEIIRRDKLKQLYELGIDPYPAPLFPVNITAAYIKQHYKGEENKADFASVCLAGRIMGIRDMG